MLWLTIMAHGILGIGVGTGFVAVVPDMKHVAVYVHLHLQAFVNIFTKCCLCAGW